MTTRNLLIVASLMASALLTLPAAAADDDPSFSIPDPASVTGQTAEDAESVAGDALVSYAAIEDHMMDAVESASTGDPSVPIGNVDGAVQNATAFADRSQERAAGLASAAHTWAFGEVGTKAQEVDYAATRTVESGKTYVSTGSDLLRSVLGSICRDSVIGDECTEDSLIGGLTDHATGASSQVTGSATNQKENVNAFKTHVQDELDLLLCGGPCD